MAVEYIHHYHSEQAQPSRKLALQIDNMQVRHSKRVILQGVNLALEEGTYACLLGESGSGKSTLLAAIAGMLKPSQGIVKLHGETVFSTQGHWLAPEKRGIGMVFQEPAPLAPYAGTGQRAIPPQIARDGSRPATRLGLAGKNGPSRRRRGAAPS